MMINKRINWIDQLKTMAIFFVLWGHFGYSDDFKTSLIYSFHMPLFFIISGFLFKPHKQSLTMSIKENFKSLGIPYLTFGGIILIIKAILSGKMYFVFILRYFTGDLFWFFPCLFIIRIIMNQIYVKNNCKLNIYILLIYFIIEPILSTISIPLENLHLTYISYAIFQAPFFMLGHILKDYLIKAKHHIYIGILSLIVLLLIMNYFNLPPSQIVHSYGDMSIRIVCALLGSLTCFHLTSLLKFIPTNYILVFSVGTAFIYPIHIILVYLYDIIDHSMNSIIEPPYITFIISVFVLSIFYIPTKYMLSKHYKLVGRKRAINFEKSVCTS